MSEPWTNFAIEGVAFPASALEGSTHKLQPWSGARKGQRNVNLKYRPRSRANARIYEYVVTGNGIAPPALGAMWPDTIYTVSCGAEICQAAGLDLERDAVDGTTRYVDAAEKDVETEDDADFVFYCPEMSMVLISIEYEQDEQGQVVSWTLTFEEVEAPDA